MTKPFRALVAIFALTLLPFHAVLAEPRSPLKPKHSASPEEPSPIIRDIRIEVRDVFDEPDLAWFYSGVNAVKISTKEYIVRQELLFKEGDRYAEYLVEESERALRRLPFLRQINITPIRDGDYVDLIVSVQDTWTLLPFLSLSLGSGKDKSAIGIAETNLLGLGKRAEILYADDEGREKIEGVWEDRRLFGSDQQLTMGVFERSDGYRGVGYYGRPYRSLIEPYSWNVDVEAYDLVGKLWEATEESFIYREKREAASGGFTVARGDPTERVNRYTLGYDYSGSEFTEADEDDYEDADVDIDEVSRDPALLADDRRYSGPFVAIQSIQPSFVSMNFVDRFERVEDFNLGNEFYARMTMASESLGSDRDTVLLNISDADGHKFSPTSFVRGKIGLITRGDSSQFTNTVVSGDLRYYNVLGAKYIGDAYVGKHTLVGSLSMDFADRLDRDKQLLLGASNGMRGYKDRTFTGEQRLVFNLEERAYYIEDVYKLISIGTAVFLDVGGTSEYGIGDILSDNLFSDVGIGLRIGFPRSSGGSVLRIDLAYPLREAEGNEGLNPRILFTSGQAVRASLPNESQQNAGANVTVRFLP